jgi:hypothetical protein
LSVLEATTPFRVHRQRRGYLKYQIRNRLLRIAQERGQSATEVEDEIRDTFDRGEPGDAIKALVTEVARDIVDPKAAETIQELSQRIAELERQNAELRQQRRTPPKEG